MSEPKIGKTALIDEITASTTGYTRKQIEEITTALLSAIQANVAAGRAVTIPGFGTWAQSQRQARMGTNIRTKQKIQIPARTGVRFTAGSEFKNAVEGNTAGATYARERAAGQATSKR